jgi:hypothetical protein
VVVAVAGCLPPCRERSVLSSRWGTPSPAGRPRNTCEGNLRRMPGDRPMRRLRDSVRRTVRRVGWAVGAGTRRLGARTWSGAGGRMDKQRRPEQRGKRDPVTLPRPDLPIVLLSHHGPVSFGRDESGRTANRGAGGLVTALIGANVGPPRRRLGMRAATDEDPLSLASTTTSVQHHPGARAAAPRPGRARLSGAPGFHRSAAPGRGRPPGPWPAMSRTEPCCGDSCTAWRWDRVAAVIDQLDVRGVLSVPVQSDGRPVGTLDVHATSRGLVGRS